MDHKLKIIACQVRIFVTILDEMRLHTPIRDWYVSGTFIDYHACAATTDLRAITKTVQH